MKNTETQMFGHRCVRREHHREWDDYNPLARPSQRAEASARNAVQQARVGEMSLATALAIAAKETPTISINPNIMEGRPCIAGTRIPVRAVLRVIEQYGSVDEAVRCYPHLTAEQVKDALYFSEMILEPPSGIDETAIAS
jgi:uncharacterized protein (DUF433 family)